MRDIVASRPAERFTPAPREDLPSLHEAFAEEDAINLLDYWRVLVKRRWLIATVLLCTLVATAIVVLSMTPIYTAEITLLIERKAPQAINLDGATAESQGPDEYDYYRTQYEILKSRGLITQVMQEQQLPQHSLFALPQEPKGLVAKWWSQAWSDVSQWLSKEQQTSANRLELPSTNAEKSADDDILASGLANAGASDLSPKMVKKYGDMLEVKPVPRTRLVKIAFSTPDPALSAQVANAHAQVYIRRGVERRSRTDEEAQGFLEEKLVELRERLEKSEAALNSYRRDQGILSFDDKENTAVDRLADLNKSLTEAETERITLETQMPLIRRGESDELPAVIDNNLIQSLKQQLAHLEEERGQLASQFKAGYPRLVDVESQIDKVSVQLRQEIQRIANSIVKSYQFAADKEKELRKKMEEQKTAVLRLKDASVKYAMLSREVDTNRELYDSVLQRIKEVGVAAELRDSNISVIDEAEPPLKPSKPRKTLSLALSALIGLMGGVGLAFFLEYLDNTLETPEEVERCLRLPNLAVIPDFDRVTEQGGYAPKALANGDAHANGFGGVTPRPYANRANGKAHPTRDLVLEHHPFSQVAEAYRTLRTAVVLSRAEEAPKVMLFTSATEGEGKTATATNTAIVFAQLGLRVLLIDADLRRARCHEVLGLSKNIGLTEFLTGRRDVRQVIKPTVVENLFFLSSGVTPPNPAELLSSRKMREMLQTLREEYDCIIIDSPPVMPVSDALLLVTRTDGVVLVVNGQTTPRDIVKEARNRLEHARAKILGIVLNRVDMRRSGYSYYYGYYSAYHTPPKKGQAGFENGVDVRVNNERA